MEGNLNPLTALTATQECFEEYEPINLDKEFADNDMLLFQYGSYNFDFRKKFYLDLTRQIKLNDKEDEFYQLSFTLLYKLKGFEEIKSYNSWSISYTDMKTWSESIKHTEGFARASETEISHYKIELNKT